MLSEQDTSEEKKFNRKSYEEIFGDFEARSNLVGLYDLALKVAKRNPELWAKINGTNI